MHNLRPILYIIGLILIALGILMLIPGLGLEAIEIHTNYWNSCTISSVITIIFGTMISLATYARITTLSTQQVFMFTTLSWVIFSAFAALPFYLSPLHINYPKSYFETMSGLTTTGGTAFQHLDSWPLTLILWRSMLHWIGGIGIILIAVAILPLLKMNGMQLMRLEFTNTIDKTMPKITQIAASLMIVYIIMSIGFAIALWICGMSVFDAINYSMSAISTGGFSPHDESVAWYKQTSIAIILIIEMIFGALSFLTHLQIFMGKIGYIKKDTQAHWFLILLFSVTIFVYIYRLTHLNFYPKHHKYIFLDVLFNVTSVFTCTGLSYSDYSAWGPGIYPIFLLITLLGGCTGSTSSGIRIFHLEILFKTAKAQIKQLIKPHGEFHVTYNKSIVPSSEIRAVLSFLFIYISIFFLFAILFSCTSLDFTSALSSSATFLANTGPGLGEIVGPAQNFSCLTSAGYWFGSIEMLLGRLDIFPILVMCIPLFWSK